MRFRHGEVVVSPAQWKTLNDQDPLDLKTANWVADRLYCHLDRIRIVENHAWPFITDAFESYRLATASPDQTLC